MKHLLKLSFLVATILDIVPAEAKPVTFYFSGDTSHSSIVGAGGTFWGSITYDLDMPLAFSQKTDYYNSYTYEPSLQHPITFNFQSGSLNVTGISNANNGSIDILDGVGNNGDEFSAVLFKQVGKSTFNQDIKNAIFSLINSDGKAFSSGALPSYFDLSHFVATVAIATSDADYSGRILDLSTTPLGNPVPEAQGWALMIVGLGVVGGVLRRKQKTQRKFQAA